MRSADVGCLVGLHFGKCWVSGAHRPNEINRLDLDCRVCRVSSREESAREMDYIQIWIKASTPSETQEIGNRFINLDLNNDRKRR